MSYRTIDNDTLTVYAICERCGQDWTFSQRYLYRTQFQKDLCRDCRTQRLDRITYSGKEYCTPHRGQFDNNDNPIKDGKLYKPGARTCGHRDCVRATHIIPSVDHKSRTEASDLVA